MKLDQFCMVMIVVVCDIAGGHVCNRHSTSGPHATAFRGSPFSRAAISMQASNYGKSQGDF